MDKLRSDDASIVVQQLISAANREWQGIYLSGTDGECDNPYDVLTAAFTQALADVAEIRTHKHQWNDNDYCAVCGADGRA